MNSNYNTKQKETIRQFFIDNPNHLYVVKEINEMLDNNNLSVGLTTIYRFLDSFTETGFLAKFVDNNCKRYAYFPNDCSNHYHVYCDKCGSVKHVDCHMFEDIDKHLSEDHGVRVDFKNKILSGRCEKCY